jgi:lipopolysaccharide transport system ATP-binding protein
VKFAAPVSDEATIALSVSGLGKKYRLTSAPQRGYVRLSESLLSWAGNPLKALARSTPAAEDFWALRDVSFAVKQGETVGVIGRNGAGKSTLLKILSRITEPTAGRIVLRGRVASLLEVGTGFHPELTGRENIYLNGAILGMRRREISARFDEIVAFAEVEKFLDTPVKRYSSGMYVRLAFAIAAHVQPDVLIVDEVLAVGDAAFQQKCLGRLSELSSRQHTTVLFVSHQMETLLRLCQRGILLHQGRIVADGTMAAISSEYHGAFALGRTSADCRMLPRAAFLRGQVVFDEVALEADEMGVQFGSSLVFCVRISWHGESSRIEACWAVFGMGGNEVASACVALPARSGGARFAVPHLRLAPGRYSVNFGLKSDRGDEDLVPQALMFDVISNETSAVVRADSIRASTIPETELLEVFPA